MFPFEVSHIVFLPVPENNIEGAGRFLSFIEIPNVEVIKADSGDISIFMFKVTLPFQVSTHEDYLIQRKATAAID